MKPSSITIGLLFIIVLIMGYFLLFPKVETILEPFDDSDQVQRIQELESAVDSLSNLDAEQVVIRDTITVIKQRVKTIYLEKYIYINTADAYGLDSIIRAGVDRFKNRRHTSLL